MGALSVEKQVFSVQGQHNAECHKMEDHSCTAIPVGNQL